MGYNHSPTGVVERIRADVAREARGLKVLDQCLSVAASLVVIHLLEAFLTLSLRMKHCPFSDT